MRLSMSRVARALVVLVLAGLVLGGCANRTKDERNALWAQNQELQEELNRSRAALDAQMAADAARAAEMERLRQQQMQQQAQQQQPAPARPIGGAEAFGGIPDVSAEMQGRNIHVTVASDILFAPGKADLSSTARSTLNRVAGVLKSEHSDNRIIVEGHTDTDPIRKSRWASNQALSEARAEAVANHLAQQGISRNRIDVVGHGSTQPRDTKARSRRVEIVVLQ